MAFNFDRLSASMRLKNDELIKRKKKLDGKKKSTFLPLGVDALFILYFTIHFNSYMSHIDSIFTVSQSNNSQISFDTLVFLGAAAATALLYLYYTQINNLKKDYEKMRLVVINSINNEFCICHQACSCKDEYILHMLNEEKINLVYE